MVDEQLKTKVEAARDVAANVSRAWKKQNTVYSEDDPGKIVEIALDALQKEVTRLNEWSRLLVKTGSDCYAEKEEQLNQLEKWYWNFCSESANSQYAAGAALVVEKIILEIFGKDVKAFGKGES